MPFVQFVMFSWPCPQRLSLVINWLCFTDWLVKNLTWYYRMLTGDRTTMNRQPFRTGRSASAVPRYILHSLLPLNFSLFCRRRTLLAVCVRAHTSPMMPQHYQCCPCRTMTRERLPLVASMGDIQNWKITNKKYWNAFKIIRGHNCLKASGLSIKVCVESSNKNSNFVSFFYDSLIFTLKSF